MSTNQPADSSASGARIPQYVLDHAPLLHLHTADPYHPSSLAAQLAHSHPALSLDPITPSNPPLSLANLEQLNAQGGKDVFLTSNDDVSTNPAWLHGVTLDERGAAGEETTGVVVVVDKGAGVVDAFYFYFWAFNFGGIVLGKELGIHVGDWEHNMIRFKDGVPQAVWLSQHANGEAYTFACLQKDESGKRPIVYAANGSHALYPTAGTYDHTIPNFNLPTPLLLVDETDAGPLYDPMLSSYFYAYTAAPPPASSNTGTVLPVAPTPAAPTSFLRFVGRWGDAEYPADDPRQKGKELFGFKKYVGGPTGPLDKQLERKEIWPENQFSGGQRVRTRLGLGWWARTWKKTKSELKGLAKGKDEKKATRIKVSGEVI